MPVKLKYGNNATRTIAKPSILQSRLVRGLIIAALGVVALGFIVFGYFYVHYQHVVDDRLSAGPIFCERLPDLRRTARGPLRSEH